MTSLIRIAFVSRRGVRARMASALFNSMAQKSRALSNAYALDEARRVPDVVETVMEELEASARAQICEALVLPAPGLIVTLGDTSVDVPKELVTHWPCLEIDGTAENARAVRDDLSSCCVMWVAREGWVDSTERHSRE
jgi:hypothetical protein